MNTAEMNRMRSRQKLKTRELKDRVERLMSDTAINMPESFADFYDKYVIWEHMSTGEPVSGLTSIQRYCLENTSCFRQTQDGKRIEGRDIWIKPRRALFTSLWLGLGVGAMMLWPNFRYVMVMPGRDSSPESRDIFGQTMRMARRLPKNWPQIVTEQSMGCYFQLENGSTFQIRGSGVSQNVSDRKGRGAPANFLHFSDAQSYQNAAITWGAMKGMLAEGSSWAVVEGTAPSSRNHWMASEWFKSHEGRGTFFCAGFIPWHMDEKRKILENSQEYARVMSQEFASEMLDARDIQREAELGLSNGQRAWRRQMFLCGDRRTIDQHRRDYPEVPEECFQYREVNNYINDDAIRMCEALVREPLVSKVLATEWIGEAWRAPGEVEHVLCIMDTAKKEGRDFSTVLALDLTSLDVVGLVHGRASPRQHYKGLLWMLDYFQCRAQNRHTVSPERNKDVGLIEDHLNRDRTLNYFRRRVFNANTGTYQKSKDIGHFLHNKNRKTMITALVQHLEGDSDVDDSDYGPQADIPSDKLVDEIRTLEQHPETGKVEAIEGCHDDIVISLACGVWLSRFVKPRRVNPVQNLNSGLNVDRQPRRRSQFGLQ